jgi:hypothetical protein
MYPRYRFNKVHSKIAHKIKKQSLERIKEIFLSKSWGDKEITPVSYRELNPFYNFAQIPTKIRYRLLIESSRL